MQLPAVVCLKEVGMSTQEAEVREYAEPVQVKRLCPATSKVLNRKQGLVEQYVSIFNNVDHGGDRVLLGFFGDSIAEFKAGERSFPAIYSHQIDDLDSWIGKVVDLEEVPPGDGRLPASVKALGGLRAQYQLYMDEPRAQKVLRLFEDGILNQASFSYGVKTERRAKDGANELINGVLFELGPTLLGMNEMTTLVGVKNTPAQAEEPAEAKAGRVHSRNTVTHLLAMRDHIDELLGQLADEHSGVEEEAKTDEPEAKVDERPSVVALRERIAAVAAGG
jgi:HK97 family phage prohead protease